MRYAYKNIARVIEYGEMPPRRPTLASERWPLAAIAWQFQWYRMELAHTTKTA